jgi:hypothetical protein
LQKKKKKDKRISMASRYAVAQGKGGVTTGGLTWFAIC